MTCRSRRSDLFATLGALQSLSARGNRLRALAPTALAGARALTSLDLADNRLALCEPAPAPAAAAGAGGYEDELGPASPLQALPGLRRLALAGNRLAAVCGDWRYVLLRLELLDLTRNSFETLTVSPAPAARRRAETTLRADRDRRVRFDSRRPTSTSSATT